MTPQNLFGEAAQGKVPETALPGGVFVMGKDLGVEAIGNIAEAIGTYAREGVARPVNALTANTIATPSGGLAPKGHENTTYKYNAADMFGVEAPTVK